MKPVRLTIFVECEQCERRTECTAELKILQNPLGYLGFRTPVQRWTSRRFPPLPDGADSGWIETASGVLCPVHSKDTNVEHA